MKKIYKSIFVIVWLLIIFYFSNQDGSTSTTLTKGLLERVLWFINNDFTFIVIRKFAHFTEYFILGLLVYNLFKEFNFHNMILCCILFCILCACFDEFHQLFISGRTAKVLDVMIDSIGSTSAVLLFNKLIKKNDC